MATYKKSKAWPIFWIFCLTFALIFAGGLIFGLQKLTDYLYAEQEKTVAAQNARPELAIEEYMANMNSDYVADRLGSLFDKVDSSVQSEEECRQVIRDTLKEGIGCQVSFTSKEKQTYVLYSKEQIDGKYPQIGTFTIAPQGQTTLGYTAWVVTEESFDMSWLLTGTVTATAPDGYPVYVGNTQLGQQHITEDNIPYGYLTEYYEKYDLPHMVTYQAGPRLGDIDIRVTDPAGNPFDLAAVEDQSVLFHNCTDAEEAALETFLKGYIRQYIRFTSSTKETRNANYKEMLKYIVEGTLLADRMEMALDGLQWSHPYASQDFTMETHHLVRLDDKTWLCDITYTTEMTSRTGTELVSTNVKFIVRQVGSELRAASMTQY